MARVVQFASQFSHAVGDDGPMPHLRFASRNAGNRSLFKDPVICTVLPVGAGTPRLVLRGPSRPDCRCGLMLRRGTPLSVLSMIPRRTTLILSLNEASRRAFVAAVGDVFEHARLGGGGRLRRPPVFRQSRRCTRRWCGPSRPRCRGSSWRSCAGIPSSAAGRRAPGP